MCFSEITFMINMEDNDDWLANNKSWKKWTRIGDEESLYVLPQEQELIPEY